MVLFDFGSTMNALSDLNGEDWFYWALISISNPFTWGLTSITKGSLKKRGVEFGTNGEVVVLSGIIGFVVLPLFLFHLVTAFNVTFPVCDTVWESDGAAQEVCE
jgi:hypothetical protein